MRKFILLAVLLASEMMLSAYSDSNLSGTNALTAEQRRWIAEHPKIRVGITPDWAPFSYWAAHGTPAGIDVDLLNVIARRTGLRFEIVATDSWDETLKLAKDRKIDLTTGTAQTSDRERLFHFTRAYYESPVVIVSREHDLRFYDVSALRGAIIATPRDHVTTTELLHRLPNAHFIQADTLLDCFKLVAQKKADATVANMVATSRYLNDYPQLNLVICGVTGYQFPLRLAVRREAPALVSILDKALASISDEELDDITSRYLPSGLQASKRGAVWHRRWWELVIVGIVLGGLLLWWNRSIRRQMRARREVEAELREINQSLEVFSHSISHDLRSPLRTIGGFALALSEDYNEKLDETAQDYLHRINVSVARMDKLICDVLAYSQASRLQLPLHPINLNDLLPQLIDELPPDQRHFFHVDSPLPKVIGNQALLSQSIANLLGNAVKFIVKGREPEIRVWAEKTGSVVKLWVEDNGIGIAPEDQERIFKMFERVSVEEYEGSGIGLAVVAKSIEKMGGSVGAFSEPGKGSRFWIQLPAANQPATRNERPGRRLPAR
ncbi:MAG: histidine kinase [Verrucomicrobiales bacterium]|nr:histidine kinase [Verrucomicrobiales bacterium]